MWLACCDLLRWRPRNTSVYFGAVGPGDKRLLEEEETRWPASPGSLWWSRRFKGPRNRLWCKSRRTPLSCCEPGASSLGDLQQGSDGGVCRCISEVASDGESLLPFGMGLIQLNSERRCRAWAWCSTNLGLGRFFSAQVLFACGALD